MAIAGLSMRFASLNVAVWIWTRVGMRGAAVNLQALLCDAD
jgi:hypothetical protein